MLHTLDPSSPVRAFRAVRPAFFTCSCKREGPERSRVCVAGELDIATTPRLERTLNEAIAQARLVVVDLRGLTFLGSSGLDVIVRAGIRARERGGRLVLLHGAAHLDRLLELPGVRERVEFGFASPEPAADGDNAAGA